MATGGVIIPVLMEYNNKGAKEAQASLKSLAKSYVGTTLTMTAFANVAQKSIRNALEDSAAQKQLSIQLVNTTGASMAQQIQVEKTVAAMQYEYATADDQLRPALASLARVTGSVTESQDLLAVALDISAATGRDVESVALVLGRAYQGNVGGLKRLGLTIDATTIKNKDFKSALEQVKTQTEGAGKAAAETSAGGFKKFSILVGDLSENLGNNLLGPLVATAGALQDFSKSAESAEKKGGLLGSTMGSLGDAFTIAFPYFAGLANLFRDNSKSTGDYTNGLQAAIDMQKGYVFQIEKLANKTTKATGTTKEQGKATDKTKQKLAELARVAREEAAAELQRLTGVYDELISKADDYRDSLSAQITDMVSLSDAVKTADQADQTYTDALKERVDAYAELNALQEERRRRGFDIGDPNITYDADSYASALKRVADAEISVTTAQSKRTNYSANFREQINAAKEFAGNLRTLASGNPPLGAAGIAQLLGLGPIAGNAVAKDLISGLAGLSVSEINSTLADLSSVGAGFGTQAAGNMFGQQIAPAAAAVTAAGGTPSVNNYVTIESYDPRAIVDQLRDFNFNFGNIAIGVGTLV